MRVSRTEREKVVELLRRDLHVTVGPGHDDLVARNVTMLLEYVDDADMFVRRVVEDTQQNLHDEFIDTDWPRCPWHPHPLWFRDGSWWCEQDNRRVAALGQLGGAPLRS